jgi:phosphopantothenoylcysteine decarboxylase/phosphopantothenate--cysteine ligase
MLKGKTVVLGVTGSIAAYKVVDLASNLCKLGADVHVIMTKNALNFITPITFETITKNKCLVDTFDRNFQFNVEHVSLAKKADIFMVAPATANIIGKIASGICDDMLTTTLFAFKGKKIISPAMNTNMYENPILQDNLEKLKKYGYEIIEPSSGLLACDDIGKGKLPDEEILVSAILRHIAYPHDLEGKKILITAGPTVEAIDPVRYITNHSTGKMGYAIAKNAYLRGADVLLISGPTSLKPFPGIKVINTISAEDMFNQVKDNYKDMDYIIMSAAVADYTPMVVASNKIKKSDDDMSIKLKRTKDILAFVGENKTTQKLIGFSMETEDMLENSKKKLIKKNCDMICANSLSNPNTGFGVDTNQITFITKDGIEISELKTKEELAKNILDKVGRL